MNIDPESLTDKVIRLGTVNARYPNRSILISVSSTKVKGQIMKAQAGYRNRNPAKRIYLAPDLSPKQRAEHKVLVDEMKRRRGQGENLKIRGGKIVSADLPNHHVARIQQHEGRDGGE